MTVSQTAPRWRSKKQYAVAALNAIVIVVVSAVIFTYEVRHSQRWAVINGFHFSAAQHANLAERELHTLLDELRALAALQLRAGPRPDEETESAEQSIRDRLARLSAARRDLMDLHEQYRRPLFREKTAETHATFARFLSAFELPTAGRLDATMMDAAIRLERKLQEFAAANLEVGKRMTGEENQFWTAVEWSLLALFILLAAMAGYVSIVVLRRLENALENEADASAQMQKAGARLDAFFGGSPAGLAIVDDDLRCEKWNETLARFGGRDPNLGECRIVDLLPEAPARSIESAMRRSLETGKPFYNMEIGIEAEPGGSGRRHWLWSHFPIQAKVGAPEGLGLVVTDISELKDAEEMLRAERNLNAAILQSANALVVVLDRDGRIVRFNRACELLTGYSSDEMVGTRVWDRLLRELDIEPVKTVFCRLTSDRLPGEYENAWLTRDGRERLIAWNNSVIQDDAGNVEFVVSIGIDVTEQRANARRMEAAARDLAMAERIAGIGSWQWTVATREERWSDQFYRNLGLEPGSCPAHSGKFYEQVHPDDREAVRRAKSNIVAAGSHYSMDFRVVRPDGSERIMHEQAEPIPGDDGTAALLVGTMQDVTELRSAERRLSRLTESFANAQRLGRIGNWDWDATTKKEWWSDEVYRIMGLKPRAVVASNDAFMERVYADDREKVAAAIEAAQEAKACYDTVFRILRPDGEERVLRETGEAVLDADGELIGLSGTVQDITEQHRAEERLARTAESLANAQRIARLGSWEWDIATNRQEWSDQVFRIFGLEPGMFQPEGYSYLQFVHPEERDAVRAAQEAAVAEGKPLSIEYRSLGADGVERFIEAYGEVEQDEAGNVVRMAGTFQDITEGRQAEQALRQSEQRFQLAFQLSPGMTAISDIETGRHIDVNDKWVEVMGHARDETVGRTAFELGVWDDPDDRARAVALLKKNKRFRDFEARFRTKNGDLRDIVIGAETIPICGKPHMLIVGYDVTERKRMERAVRDSEELFRSLFDQAAVGIAQVRPDGRFARTNRKLAEILRYPREELEALRFHDITHPDDLEADLEQHERLLAGEISFYTMEKRYVRGDATIVWGNLTVSLVRHEDGTPKYVVGIIQDIGDRKQAEQALAETLHSLAEAQRIGQIGSWELDPASGAIVWSDENYRLLGLDPESVEPALEMLLEMVHPDDREALKARNRQAAADGVVEQIEYRLIRPDGTTRLMHSRGEVVRSEDGSIQRLRGTVQDITERKQAELALQNALEKLEEAQRLAHVGHWEWNPETNNSIWSHENYRIFGVEPDPEGKPPTHDMFMNIVHDDDRDELEGLMARALETGASYVTEYKIVRPDGELRHIHERAERYIDDKTGRASIGGVVQDITERKHIEQELARLNAELERRVEERTAELREAQAELVKSERLATLGQLTATVSHELRNPLGAMRTSMYVVEKKTEGRDAGVIRAIERVNRNITRCDQIIDELLDYTRIRDLELHSLEIDDWLGNVLDEQPVPGGITVRRKLCARGLRVPADGDRLRRAVINIYDNACHALTGPAEGDKAGGKKWLSVETHAKKDRLEIVVSDNGPGIPDDLRDRVFEPLFSTKNFGVGLGLPTVRQIMEQHGGGVVVSQRRGGGAKFALWLPLAREAEAAGL